MSGWDGCIWLRLPVRSVTTSSVYVVQQVLHGAVYDVQQEGHSIVGLYLKHATKAQTVFSRHCFLMGMVVKRVNKYSMPPQPAKLYQVKKVLQLVALCFIHEVLKLSKHTGHSF